MLVDKTLRHPHNGKRRGSELEGGKEVWEGEEERAGVIRVRAKRKRGRSSIHGERRKGFSFKL